MNSVDWYFDGRIRGLPGNAYAGIGVSIFPEAFVSGGEDTLRLFVT
jgi:hypothetical protein